MFLVHKMGFGWEAVHQIAEQLEHIHSELFFDKMDELLNYPKIDPHGEPIPDKDGNIIQQNLMKLSECKAGDEVALASVTESSDSFLTYLSQRELQLNTKIKILKVEAFDHSMSVSFGIGKNETLSKMVCDKILVEKI